MTELMTRARTWLVGRHYILPRERDIRRQALAARRHQEQRIYAAIEAAAPLSVRQDWLAKLAEARDPDQITHLEWLSATPATRSAKALEEQLKKVEFLRGLGADRVNVADLPSAGLVSVRSWDGSFWPPTERPLKTFLYWQVSVWGANVL